MVVELVKHLGHMFLLEMVSLLKEANDFSQIVYPGVNAWATENVYAGVNGWATENVPGVKGWATENVYQA